MWRDVDTTAPTRIRIQPGFAVIIALFGAVGWSLHGFAADRGHPVSDLASFVAVFTAVLLVLTAVHEAGHALVGRLGYRHQVTQVRFGMHFGVTVVGEHTRMSLALCALAGPVIGIVAALPVFALAPLWSAPYAAALVALVMNFANCLPLPGSDGLKVLAVFGREPQGASNL